MIEYFIKFGNHWMIFEVYLHFAVYWYNYNFFINILFNYLISISKWDFFNNLILWVLNYSIPSTICKKSFNINLIEVQKHVILKSSICDNNLWPSYYAFTQIWKPKFANFISSFSNASTLTFMKLLSHYYFK